MIYLQWISVVGLGLILGWTLSVALEAVVLGKKNFAMLKRLWETEETATRWVKSDIYSISKQVTRELIDEGWIKEDIKNITRGYEELSSRVQRLIEAVEKLAKPCAKKKEKKQ